MKGVKRISILNKEGKRCFSSGKVNEPNLPKDGIEWEKIGFSLTRTDFMYITKLEQGKDKFEKGKILPYGPISLEPAATVLNYGQGSFEGIKAFRHSKNGVRIFRPLENSIRMRAGAERFLMPAISDEVFMDGINKVVQTNSSWIPPFEKGALYLRPMLFGSGAALGVAPSTEFTFLVYASPVGNYFKGGLKPIELLVTDYHRAPARGGGFVKAIGNYAPCFLPQMEAKKSGYAECLFLDAKKDEFVEEAGASNFFCVTHDGVLHTPALGTILDGVTRKSIIELAKQKGYKVEEHSLSITTVLSAKEAFCTGTGASVSPVGAITFHGKKAVFNNNEVGKVTREMYQSLLDIQLGRTPDQNGWLTDPYQQN